MKLTVPYNVISKQRKQLAEDASVALHTIPKYLGYPTCAYQIGDCTLERDGKLIIPDEVDDDVARNLLEYLKERGWVGEAVETQDKLTISLPRTLLTDNQITILQQIATARGALFRSAFLADSIEVEVSEETISFPWFPFTTDADEVNAYSVFVSKLCELAKKQKRVQTTLSESDNPKYTFRCFLIRLGLVGESYKTTRKILMKNLSGCSAYRHGTDREIL